MPNLARLETDSILPSLLADFNAFDGSCDPAFDNDFEELERQFAEFRCSLASE